MPGALDQDAAARERPRRAPSLDRQLAVGLGLVVVPAVGTVAIAWAHPAWLVPVAGIHAVLAVAAALVVRRWLQRAVATPVDEVRDRLERLGGGELSSRLFSHRPDHLGALASTVDELAARLEARAARAGDGLLRDPLTGLADRVLVQDRIGHALHQAGRNGDAIAVLLLDLDDFKMVNDSLGHEVGDRLLLAASERISGCLRLGDTAGRLGGDEFAVLLEGVGDGRVAQEVADRLNRSLAAPFQVDGTGIHLHASIGIAVSSPVAGDTAMELLRNAELAMYAAKERGKGRAELFESPMHAAAVERLSLDGELRRAIPGGELRLHHQPVIDLATGSILGCEALVRWQHPVRGLLGPADFIPLAEETGLVVDLGWWVLQTACDQLADWQQRFARPLTANVNLSARQLQDPALVDGVEAVLGRTGLDPASLCLEVTESVMLLEADLSHDRLGALRALGVRIAIDDFGTGYSNLRYLQDLPVDVLKVDKAFVDGIDVEGPAPLAEAIIGLAHRLDLVAVAEGIEREAQVEPLRRLGCGVGQGFWFQRPAPPEQIEALLATDSGHLHPS